MNGFMKAPAQRQFLCCSLSLSLPVCVCLRFTPTSTTCSLSLSSARPFFVLDPLMTSVTAKYLVFVCPFGRERNYFRSCGEVSENF